MWPLLPSKPARHYDADRIDTKLHVTLSNVSLPLPALGTVAFSQHPYWAGTHTPVLLAACGQQQSADFLTQKSSAHLCEVGTSVLT